MTAVVIAYLCNAVTNWIYYFRSRVRKLLAVIVWLYLHVEDRLNGKCRRRVARVVPRPISGSRTSWFHVQQHPCCTTGIVLTTTTPCEYIATRTADHTPQRHDKMVVVRESPRAKVSPDKNNIQWPPKSPFQALLASPSGRRKWQDHKNARERSVSPSPSKGPLRSPGTPDNIEVRDFADDIDDDDEETLRLRLQAIQAKLKLKKLQQQKAKRDGTGSSEKESSTRPLSRPPSSPSKSSFEPQHGRPRSAVDRVEVPLSPSKERTVRTIEPVSPARRLGLPREPRAEDVSLKRPRVGVTSRAAENLRRAQAELDTPKSSFGERLNRSRAEARDRQIKNDRIEQARSKGFGPLLSEAIAHSTANIDFDALRTTVDTSGKPSSAHQMQAPSAIDRDAAVSRSQSLRSRPDKRTTIRPNELLANLPQSTQEGDGEVSPGFDAFSQIHLSKRNMPHVEVARAMEGKEVYTLPRLLKEVKAPDYEAPDCENDFVVLAILASKSSPFDQKSAQRTSDDRKPQEDADGPRKKFMVLHLCDGAKWEVDCFLFGSAFDQFWKITPGTLLAILNPGIMSPKGNKHSGAFSLRLGSSEDSVLEIGIARDLGYCSSVKKDGTLCGDWVDKRKTTICEFHLNLEIERSRRGRMEVNTMWHKNRGGGDGERRRVKSKNVEARSLDKELDNKNVSFDREYGRLYSMPSSGGTGFGRTTAKLLDAEDTTEAMFGVSNEDASRKRIAEAQKERDLAKTLAKLGGSAGAEYLRIRQKTTLTTTTTTSTSNGIGSTPRIEKPTASSLGLLGNKAEDQRLSPAKDRRRHFGLGAISSSGTDAMGWGGARKAGLLDAKKSRLGSPEKGQTKLVVESSAETGVRRPGIVRGRSTDGDGRLSPKKRARFALEKGIREPGRESLPGKVGRVGGVEEEEEEEDDDDGLDIV